MSVNVLSVFLSLLLYKKYLVSFNYPEKNCDCWGEFTVGKNSDNRKHPRHYYLRPRNKRYDSN